MLDWIKHLIQINQTLRVYPKGLILKEVSNEVNINRNSVSVYLDFMFQIGMVELRPVGIAKMYFATE